MYRYLLTFFFIATLTVLSSQSNFVLTHPEADAILKGDYDPTEYLNANPTHSNDAIFAAIDAQVSPNSL